MLIGVGYRRFRNDDVSELRRTRSEDKLSFPFIGLGRHLVKAFEEGE